MDCPMSSPSSRLLDLPPELIDQIMRHLNLRSLLNLTLTSKRLYTQIKFSEHLMMKIEIEQAHLFPIMPVSTPAAWRYFVKQHQIARLNVPIEARAHVSLTAPPQTRSQRVFRGFLACLSGPDLGESTEPLTLHVWDIRRADPTQPPRKVLTMSKPKLFDVVIDTRNNLLALLFYWAGDDWATIQFLDLNSIGKRPHPSAKSEFITHTLSLEDEIVVFEGERYLSVSGTLAAIAYDRCMPEGSYVRRRGTIWNWKTGDVVYDSANFESISKFHSLALLPSQTFLIAACPPDTIDIVEDEVFASNVGWIELRKTVVSPDGSSTTSRLVAQFDLPEVASDEPPNFKFRHSETMWDGQLECVGNIFPFVTNPLHALQVLKIQFGTETAYLIIVNELFQRILCFGNLARFPLRFNWSCWDKWTSLWDQELGAESVVDFTLNYEVDITHQRCSAFSVCGSRICAVAHHRVGYEVFLVDFNMNIPCAESNCVDPLIHFSPETFRPNSILFPLPWQNTMGLPFHSQSKRIEIKTNDDYWEIGDVVMDEERIVLTICKPDALFTMRAVGWKIVHMLYLGENPSIISSDSVPWMGNSEDRSRIRHYETCRLCEREAHTDLHILLECNAHPEVVEIRRIFFEGFPELGGLRPQFRESRELLDEFRAHPKGELRRVLLPMVFRIKKVYDALPEGDRKFITPGRDKPASVLFVKRDSSNEVYHDRINQTL